MKINPKVIKVAGICYGVTFLSAFLLNLIIWACMWAYQGPTVRHWSWQNNKSVWTDTLDPYTLRDYFAPLLIIGAVSLTVGAIATAIVVLDPEAENMTIFVEEIFEEKDESPNPRSAVEEWEEPNLDPDDAKWEIEPHPFDSDYDTCVTDIDATALEVFKLAAERAWDEIQPGEEKIIKIRMRRP